MVFDFYTLHVTSYKKIPAVSEFLRYFPILTVEIFVEYTQNAILSTHLIRPYSLISAHYVCTYVHNNISHSIIKLRHLKFLCPTYAICITSIWFHKSQSLLSTCFVRLKICTNSNMKSSLYIWKNKIHNRYVKFGFNQKTSLGYLKKPCQNIQ